MAKGLSNVNEERSKGLTLEKMMNDLNNKFAKQHEYLARKKIDDLKEELDIREMRATTEKQFNQIEKARIEASLRDLGREHQKRSEALMDWWEKYQITNQKNIKKIQNIKLQTTNLE